MKILLSLSFSGALLFLIVFLVVRSCRNRLSRRWQYYIWLLVVLRFLVPVTSTHTLTGYLFRGMEQAVEERYSAVEAEESGTEVNGAADVVVNSVRDSENGADKTEGSIEKQTSSVDRSRSEGRRGIGADETVTDKAEQDAVASGRVPGLNFWLSGIWAAGAFALLIRKIAAYRSYMRFLRNGNLEVSDLATLNLLAEAEEGLKIGRTVELYRNPTITSPIMTGFVKPRIVLPDRKISDTELTCIFTHELVHFKYYDMFYKWLVQVTICIHWFNPFVWLLGKEVNKCCELACDEKVIGMLNEQARKDYGDTLLSFLKRGETYQNPLASITLTEGAEQLIERLGAIMDYRKKSGSVILLTTALTVLLCFFFSGIGAYAGAKDTGRKDTEKTAMSIAAEEEAFSDDQVWQDGDYSVFYDEEANTYYILIEGAEITDRPTGGGSGSLNIVLVKKYEYAAFSFGYPFFGYPSLKAEFLEEVEDQCREAIENGWISEAEADLIRKTAMSIAAEDGAFSDDQKADAPKSGHYYTYYQMTQYAEPYLIEFGWNLNTEDMEYYTHKEILLKNQSRISVCFSEEAGEWMTDVEAMEAVAELLGETKQIARGQYGLEFERPYLVRIVYLPPDEIGDFARRAFEEEDIADFSAVAGLLSEDEKREYCEKSYEKDDAGFFSIIISEMGEDYVADFAERCYEKDDITYFSIAAGDLSEEARKTLMERALRENQDDYYYILKWEKREDAEDRLEELKEQADGLKELEGMAENWKDMTDKWEDWGE